MRHVNNRCPFECGQTFDRSRDGTSVQELEHSCTCWKLGTRQWYTWCKPIVLNTQERESHMSRTLRTFRVSEGIAQVSKEREIVRESIVPHDAVSPRQF